MQCYWPLLRERFWCKNESMKFALNRANRLKGLLRIPPPISEAPREGMRGVVCANFALPSSVTTGSHAFAVGG